MEELGGGGGEFAGKFAVDRGTGCWVWHSRTSRGYGQVRVGRRNLPAHRVVYERLRGPIPAGMVLDHLCRNRGCVNPAHLEPVTTGENTRRGLCQKVTPAQAKAIVARRRAGESIRRIARDYGINPGQVCRIAARQNRGAA